MTFCETAVAAPTAPLMRDCAVLATPRNAGAGPGAPPAGESRPDWGSWPGLAPPGRKLDTICVMDPKGFCSMGCTVAVKTSREMSCTAVRASLFSEVSPWLISCWDPAVSGAARAAERREAEGKSVVAREANAAARVPLDLPLSEVLGLGVLAEEPAS